VRTDCKSVRAGNFVKLGFYEVYVSEYVIQELNQVPDQAERERLLNVLTDYPIELRPVTSFTEVGFLARNYLDRGVMPPKKLLDALHVAFCVFDEFD